MKKILLIVTLIFSYQFAQSQPPTYDDLLILYADEDYDKCLRKAERYTQKDDTKRDPMPYLYLSKCNFAMSKDAEWKEKYPDSYKDAFSYAGRARRADRDSTIYDEHRDYFSELKKSALEEILNLMDEGSYGRALGSIFKVRMFAFEDVGSMFMLAACYLEKRNGSKAYQLYTDGMKELNKIKSFDDMRSEDIILLKKGLMYYAQSANKNYMQDNAKKAINAGYQWFQDDEEYQKTYDELVN